MPLHTVVVVADAHLGSADPADAAAFLRFLDAVPDLGRHLVINGDLFDFWFEYRSVIPRRAFPVLSALHRLRGRGVAITLTGGNHDRWGGPFWTDELGATFLGRGGSLDLAGWRAFLHHGDGLVERHVAARVMHAVTRWPLTAAAFRLLHPDLGIRLVHAMSGLLAESTRDGPALDRAAAAQAGWAREYLARNSAVDLVVLAHTHRAACEAAGDRRWYLNPGPWMGERRYAVVDAQGPALRAFD
ncbi:MAG TPA: UDP-2,3-diacylglucosamine diphosphatase [Gemmatimonadales bacterium]|nr:UDP-2,3-diacylglucosamine diphosphatase [Gemmatimonadales bacterium]